MLLNRHKNLVPAYFAEALKIGDVPRVLKILSKKIESLSIEK
jgi:hypothetical protein